MPFTCTAFETETDPDVVAIDPLATEPLVLRSPSYPTCADPHCGIRESHFHGIGGGFIQRFGGLSHAAKVREKVVP